LVSLLGGGVWSGVVDGGGGVCVFGLLVVWFLGGGGGGGGVLGFLGVVGVGGAGGGGGGAAPHDS
jgi:hypothetical protein